MTVLIENNVQNASEQMQNEGGKGDPNKANPISIEKYIKGINFPVSKNDLVNKAKENGAPPDVVNVLNQLEDKQYNTPVDISKEVG